MDKKEFVKIWKPLHDKIHRNAFSLDLDQLITSTKDDSAYLKQRIAEVKSKVREECAKIAETLYSDKKQDSANAINVGNFIAKKLRDSK